VRKCKNCIYTTPEFDPTTFSKIKLLETDTQTRGRNSESKKTVCYFPFGFVVCTLHQDISVSNLASFPLTWAIATLHLEMLGPCQ